MCSWHLQVHIPTVSSALSGEHVQLSLTARYAITLDGGLPTQRLYQLAIG